MVRKLLGKSSLERLKWEKNTVFKKQVLRGGKIFRRKKGEIRNVGYDTSNFVIFFEQVKLSALHATVALGEEMKYSSYSLLISALNGVSG
jgi:hypothetical protein